MNHTSEEIRRCLSLFTRYSLRYPIFNAVTMVSCVSLDGTAIELEIEATVPDRYSGKPIHVRFVKDVAIASLLVMRDPDRAVEHIIRSALIEMMTHEMDEMLERDRQQVRNPHVRDAITNP